jgi:hypothetical protein
MNTSFLISHRMFVAALSGERPRAACPSGALSPGFDQPGSLPAARAPGEQPPREADATLDRRPTLSLDAASAP